MLNLTNSINKIGEKLLFPYKILNNGGTELYICGASKILKFTEEQIVLALKNKKIVYIVGKQMYIKELSPSGIFICGEISLTEVK